MNANAGNTFVDGVYVGAALLTTDLDNLERVEIMRGPQSAQFGRNTYVGAINYVTRKPSEKLEGKITATGGQHDTFNATGWLSGPLGTERLRFAVGAGHHEYGGDWTNQRDGSEVGGEESDEVTAKLLFQPVNELDITLKLGWQGTDDDHFAMYLQPATLNNCCERTADAPRAREYYVGKAVVENQVNLYTDLLEENGGAGTEQDRVLGSLAVNWQLGGLTLTSLTGLIHDEYDLGFDSSLRRAYDRERCTGTSRQLPDPRAQGLRRFFPGTAPDLGDRSPLALYGWRLLLRWRIRRHRPFPHQLRQWRSVSGKSRA